MKTFTKEIQIKTEKRIDFVNITSKIESSIKESQITDGLLLINPMHITASVFINDYESGLIQDFKEWLEKLAPKNFNYHHHQTGEDNGFSHIWRTMMGREVTCAITDGKLHFGPWESIWYGEFDGLRQKRILIKIIGK